MSKKCHQENTTETRRLRFPDDTASDPDRFWSVVNPLHEGLGDAAHTARYALGNLTQTQAYLLCEAYECYIHLTAHPTSTKNIIAQLRKIRAAVKKRIVK